MPCEAENDLERVPPDQEVTTCVTKFVAEYGTLLEMKFKDASSKLWLKDKFTTSKLTRTGSCAYVLMKRVPVVRKKMSVWTRLNAINVRIKDFAERVMP